MVETKRLRSWMILVILACAGLYLVGNGRVPLWDRDEGWYAQCSKEMWETGDWVVPRFLGGLRAEKPVFVYWLQLAGYGLFGGVSEFAVRFYAAIAQAVTVGIVGFSVFKMAGPMRGVWAALIYGTCAMAVISGKMCLTDATMMVFLMIAQMCLLTFYLGNFSWWGVVVLFVSLGFGGLAKGPVALVPSALTIIALGVMDFRSWWPRVRSAVFEPVDGAMRWVLIVSLIIFGWLQMAKHDMPELSKVRFAVIALFPLCLIVMSFWDARRGKQSGLNLVCRMLLLVLGGLVLILAVSAPWLWLLYERAPRWIELTLNMAGQHLNTPLEGHSGPFGYYMMLVWGTFFPWSLLIPTALYVAWKQRHVPQTRFAIAAFIGPWLFFEMMQTKLPHYVLPTFPFLAMLVADAVVRCTRGQYLEFYKKRFTVSVWVWAGVIGVLGCAPWLFTLKQLKAPWMKVPMELGFGPQPVVPMTALAVVGFVFTLGVAWFFWRRRPYMACAWMGAGWIAFVAVGYAWYLPEAKFLQLSYQVAKIVNANGGGADKMGVGEIVSLVYPTPEDTIGYQEPSLPFYQGGTLRLIEVNDYLEITPEESWPKMMVLTSDIWEVVSPEKQAQLEVLGKVRGLAYADGGKVYDVMVVKKKRSPEPEVSSQ